MITRRLFVATGAAAVLAGPALAVSTSQAQQLTQRVVNDIMAIVNSGKSKSAAVRDFEGMLVRHADMAVIARSILGPASRSTSSSDLASFTKALQGYLARKYGRQFEEFKGGSISVAGGRDRGRFVEVPATAKLPGRSSINVTFRVWDKSGSPKFIDILTEGISLVTTERAEIGALLSKRGGSVSRLTRDLAKLG